MSQTFKFVQRLVAEGEVKISSHGYDELAEDSIFVNDILLSIKDAKVVEDYPNFGKGPCVLVLQYDRDSKPIHVVGEYQGEMIDLQYADGFYEWTERR